MFTPRLYLDNIVRNDLIDCVEQEKNVQNITIKNGLGQILKIEYYVPIIDLQLLWHPTVDGVLFLKNEWDQGVKTRLNQSLPLLCLLNQNNKSLFSLAVNELVNELELTVGVHEESASVKITIETLIPVKNYTINVSIMDDEKPWFEIVRKQVNWLYQESGAHLPQLPDASFDPVLSTWYSFHQNLTSDLILEECRAYRNFGTKTLILDDGWQTTDSNRRYAFAGDWQVSDTKFPDFQSHVKNVQDLGMNYLVWVSLPYIGEKSKNWELFEHDLLYIDAFQRAGILDIRKEKVRQYLVEIIGEFIRKYSINGLKIDFLETFFLNQSNNYDISKGLLQFLEEMKASLKDQPELLIEFRQDYINPLMMQYCQIVRSKDCPNNYLLNRIRIIDLRLSCPFTVVHSDMIMWNKNEKIEDAALHIINTLFSVPQLSMRYESLSNQEIKMISFWLDFMKEHQNLLLKTVIEPYYPQEGYSIVRVRQSQQTLIVVFGEKKIIDSTTEDEKQRIFVNGTKEEQLFIVLPSGKYKAMIRNCLGEIVDQKNITLLDRQLQVMDVPRSGILIIDTE